jgi:transposase
LPAAEIKPHLLEQWLLSELGPDFDAQAAEVCGLYLDPRQGTLVVSIDEKTGIQAKAPTRPDVRARPGRPARREHEYRRNGTQNLFAALRVHTGEVSAMPSKTRNRFDLIRFLDRLEAEIPAGRQVIAITDNLSTRTTDEVAQWLEDHPRWRFVFTPKHASWLNQVEIFFSILARPLLKRGAFTDEQDLAQQMLAFVETYNQTARPFNWTNTGKVLAA